MATIVRGILPLLLGEELTAGSTKSRNEEMRNGKWK